jgi:hypothetical protein
LKLADKDGITKQSQFGLVQLLEMVHGQAPRRVSARQARGLRYEAKPNGRLQNKVEAKPIFQYTVGHTFAYNF